MSDEQNKSYDDGEFGYGEIDEPKRSKSTITIIGLGLTFVAIVVGILLISYIGIEQDDVIPVQENSIPEIIIDDIPEEQLLSLEVTDQLPSALSHMEIDWVGSHMDHIKPAITDLQNTLVWAKQSSIILSSSTNTESKCPIVPVKLDENATATLTGPQIKDYCNLNLIESDILKGAKQNSNKITVGEQVMLEIINWAKYPQLCDEPHQSSNCEFFDINYQEGRYQSGDITRDEYWLNIRQYANHTIVDQVEGNLGG